MRDLDFARVGVQVTLVLFSLVVLTSGVRSAGSAVNNWPANRIDRRNLSALPQPGAQRHSVKLWIRIICLLLLHSQDAPAGAHRTINGCPVRGRKFKLAGPAVSLAYYVVGHEVAQMSI